MDAAALVSQSPLAQAAAMRDGQVSAVDLAAATLEAARELDARVNAFAALDADGAHAAAQEADRRRAAGEDGPLLGVPIAVKDDLDAAGHVTSWGSRARTTPARADGPVVTMIRAAGMVPVGRTTLPELAIHGFTESARFGVTCNPIDPGRTSGGSSGGSAAAVAGGAVGIATASDGGGSIRIPASCCGLVGIKPGAGRTPGGGWNGLSVQGCLTRRVADSATYLDLLGDFATPLAAAAEQDPPPLRIGVDLASPATPALPLDPELEAAVRRAADVLAGLGHQVRDVRVRYGAAPAGFVARMLHGIAGAAADVDDPSLLEARTAEVARIGRRVPDAAVVRARRQGEAFGHRVLADLGVDVLLTPPARGPAVPVGHWDGRRGLTTMLGQARQYAHTPPWNHAGIPAAVVPVTRSDLGLPLAVQCVVGPDQDARLVSVAAQIERAFSP
ncbi:amidase [Actinomycetospora succinea]|uniref:Amidase n=1 Tax=Actinomycetospora succinea TaxID=663603 RepID=A0A4V3DAR7_9PSEU|nr:amidase family protein [Actinomycetospora succinea]TDQ63313.1 amidase [Actinomycetospora succinea]